MSSFHAKILCWFRQLVIELINIIGRLDFIIDIIIFIFTSGKANDKSVKVQNLEPNCTRRCMDEWPILLYDGLERDKIQQPI